jgi:hypothetical protein
MDKEEFLLWEKASKDTIDVKKIYIDIAGDVVGGIILSQIIYWHLPSKNGKRRLQVFKNGDENKQPGYWLAKSNKAWYAECRVKEDTAMRRIQKLANKGIIETHIWRFNSAPTTHIRIVWDKFLSELENVLNKQDEEIEDRNLPTAKQANSSNPRMQIADVETSKQQETLTENTTENTRETTTMNTSKNKEYSTISEKIATDKPYVDIPAGSSLDELNGIENPGDDIPAVSRHLRDSASVKKDRDWNPKIPALETMTQEERIQWAYSVKKRCYAKKRGYTRKELAELEKYKLPTDIMAQMCVGGFLSF